jgi:hypothetical protein
MKVDNIEVSLLSHDSFVAAEKYLFALKEILISEQYTQTEFLL